MLKFSRKKLCVSSLAGAMFLASGAVIAADKFDGSSNFLCAAMGVSACIDGTICSEGQAREFDMPDFMMVDFKNRVIRAVYDGGKEATSEIKNMEMAGSQLILQGVENDHGWSMAVHRENGRMSVGAVGHEVSFTISGACTVL
jgi:hypothetical protein